MNATESVDAILRLSSLFASLNDDELRELARLATLRRAHPDEVLFREGDNGSCLFVVIAGTVRLSTTDSRGRVQPTALLGTGQAFGEMAVLDGSTRSATATSTAESTLARIDNDDLERLAAKFPDSKARILREGMRLVSDRLRKSNARFWDLARNAMKQKRQFTQSRARFLSLISHELRTPLAVIKSSAQLMLRAPDSNPSNFLSKIVSESNHLAMLIDDLITFSILQSDVGLQDRSEFDAVQLSQNVIRGLSGTAADRGVQLSLKSSADVLRIMGDPFLIRRALHHLTDNAVKFSRPSSQVVVSLSDDSNGRTSLSVIDHGLGIPPERLASLLQSFVQAEGPLNRTVDGMGIGLSLVDEVVRAHGGRLLVDSVPGRGSRFTISLPEEPDTSDFRGELVSDDGGSQ